MTPAELAPAAGGDPDVGRPACPRRVVLIWLERAAQPACTGEGQRWRGADDDHKDEQRRGPSPRIWHGEEGPIRNQCSEWWICICAQP